MAVCRYAYLEGAVGVRGEEGEGGVAGGIGYIDWDAVAFAEVGDVRAYRPFISITSTIPSPFPKQASYSMDPEAPK